VTARLGNGEFAASESYVDALTVFAEETGAA
jgi:hypothetical protein